ncbi:hypothetical protein VPNG_09369 [Cytospora leucostoma]|uniref:SH3 domain-containing protein n=1 Tax=Cytospora leucostoma TaxID=1230097 RepID=A0A423VSS4_9PEZI|nr:hypothetical protein VPNG_09369 [Cytospora leucostoma]
MLALAPASEGQGPTVSLSFANNFWGKEDAGVQPMLERMHAAKQTCDELRSFYAARASIEDEYARKLLSLCKKSLGSQELGSLRTSLDTVRGEVESMAKQHQGNAAQMRSELEEPLTAFAGGMKERRKIVQNGIEKLLKVKQQQTALVNKVGGSPSRPVVAKLQDPNFPQTKDKYEQECLKIKGYLAQGHMVMGQEERKNKAKLEKTQINLATSNTEYENAVKALEETTARWNREWKAAADKFQDLEEERLDFTKSSLWTFANISSTVCVSDDASCEKIRLSLEKMEVEKDIVTFIKERGTGQEIPDPPKYINFCRGDLDAQSEISAEDEAYSVAQFPRSINPAFRSSSPQPSTFESHHDPTSALAKELGHGDPGTPSDSAQVVALQKLPPQTSEPRPRPSEVPRDVPRDLQRKTQPQISAAPVRPRQMTREASREVQMEVQRDINKELPPLSSNNRQKPRQLSRDDYASRSSTDLQFNSNEFAPVPHDPYPMDGMTMLCRTGNTNGSDLGSAVSATSGSERPSSRDERSDYSAPTSFSSRDPLSGPSSPVKQDPNKSPFSRRKSIKDPKEVAPNNRNTWSIGQTRPSFDRPQLQGANTFQNLLPDRATASPDPIDANADVAINVGENVLPVNLPGRQKPNTEPEPQEDDPIAQALAELRGVTSGKQSTARMSADHYHGIATPAPGAQPLTRSMPPLGGNGVVAAGMRGTPPPSYDQPVQRLGVPAPACTSRAMKETSQKYTQQTRSLFSGDKPGSRPTTRGSDMPRAASPAPPRGTSPRPGMNNRASSPNFYAEYAGSTRGSTNNRSTSPNPYAGSTRGSMYNRSASPNPYAASQRSSMNSRQGSVQMDNATPNRNSGPGFYNRNNSPNDMARAASPAPYRGGGASEYGRPTSRSDYGRPASRADSSFSGGPDMARGMSPAPTENSYAGSTRGRGGRPGTSQGNRGMSLYEPPGAVAHASRQRSKSVVDGGRQYTKDGRLILHFARALYMYQAAIPEELGFSKGDILAVLRHQDDGWWEAEVHGGNGLSGLVPSNYLQAI